MPPLEVDVLLVPVDGSVESITAVEHALAVAERYDARVHALYVLPDHVARALDNDTIAPAAVAGQSRAFVFDLQTLARKQDVDLRTSLTFGFSPTRKTQHPGSVILDCAEEVHADFIVVPREPVSSAADVLEKAAEYVLLYASQPVLSV